MFNPTNKHFSFIIYFLVFIIGLSPASHLSAHTYAETERSPYVNEFLGFASGARFTFGRAMSEAVQSSGVREFIPRVGASAARQAASSSFSTFSNVALESIKSVAAKLPSGAATGNSTSAPTTQTPQAQPATAPSTSSAPTPAPTQTITPQAQSREKELVKLFESSQKFSERCKNINLKGITKLFIKHTTTNHIPGGEKAILGSKSIFNPGEDFISLALDAWEKGKLIEVGIKEFDVGRIVGISKTGRPYINYSSCFE